MTSASCFRFSAGDKLEILRRLDEFRFWHSLDDERICARCGQTITGREIEILQPCDADGRLSLRCPTENCPAEPGEWSYRDPVAAAEGLREAQAADDAMFSVSR